MNKINRIKRYAGLLIGLIGFVACENNYDDLGADYSGGIVPIEIEVEPLDDYEIVTRAPVYGWKNVSVYYAYGKCNHNGGSFNRFEQIYKGVVNGLSTSFQPLLFYPAYGATGGDSIFVRGFHPRSVDARDLIPENSGSLSFDDGKTNNGAEVHYTLTGQEDIMISSVVTGTVNFPIRYQPAPANRLQYQHLLTQVYFKIKNAGSFPPTLKLKRLVVSGDAVHDKATLYLENGHHFIPANITKDVLTFSNSATPDTILVYNSSPVVLPLEDFALTPILGRVMFEAEQTFEVTATLVNAEGKELSLPVIFAKGISIDKSAKAGSAYEIRLTFGTVDLIPVITGETWLSADVSGVKWPGDIHDPNSPYTGNPNVGNFW